MPSWSYEFAARRRFLSPLSDSCNEVRFKGLHLAALATPFRVLRRDYEMFKSCSEASIGCRSAHSQQARARDERGLAALDTSENSRRLEVTGGGARA